MFQKFINLTNIKIIYSMEKVGKYYSNIISFKKEILIYTFYILIYIYIYLLNDR
jgi:hypothetical protein